MFEANSLCLILDIKYTKYFFLIILFKSQTDRVDIFLVKRDVTDTLHHEQHTLMHQELADIS